jgi:hypothetical protein
MDISDLHCRSNAPISFMVRFINTPHMLTQVGQKSGCAYGMVLPQHPAGTSKNPKVGECTTKPGTTGMQLALTASIVYKACESANFSVQCNCNRTLLISTVVGVRHTICGTRVSRILCSVDRTSLYNIVNETNLVLNILSIFRQFYL